jgi:hypothetical protein
MTVRCALRVRPYFETAWPEAPWAITQVLDHLINFALLASDGRAKDSRTRLTFGTVGGCANSASFKPAGMSVNLKPGAM